VPSSTISSPPTSAPPTTPTPGGTFTVPSSLIGLPINDAESILDSYGIAYTAVAQPNDSALPNTVINTSPAAGQAVPNGGAVTLYYAQPTAPSTPSTPSTATTPTGSATPTS
jgi:beta-lactam-binding protein with PASTA domain